MKVLFISSGNSIKGISPIIKNQGESITSLEIEITYFTIKGKKLFGYFKNISKIHKIYKNNKFDIVHAHYSLSAFVASLAGAKPLIVSLMGSDVKSKTYYKYIIHLFNRLFWNAVIVKSKDMKLSINIMQAKIIPNGVDFAKFNTMDQIECKKKLEWDISKKQILFAASINRYEKNYQLAKEAFKLLNNSSIELKVLDNVPNNMMPIYHNAANIVLLTSLWEGSPNVIKEAMACNIPIVSTDVGDVKEVIGDTRGCYITSFDPEDVANKIKKALDFGKKTKGRNRITELELDSKTIADKIINVYKKVLNIK